MTVVTLARLDDVPNVEADIDAYFSELNLLDRYPVSYSSSTGKLVTGTDTIDAFNLEDAVEQTTGFNNLVFSRQATLDGGTHIKDAGFSLGREANLLVEVRQGTSGYSILHDRRNTARTFITSLKGSTSLGAQLSDGSFYWEALTEGWNSGSEEFMEAGRFYAVAAGAVVGGSFPGRARLRVRYDTVAENGLGVERVQVDEEGRVTLFPIQDDGFGGPPISTYMGGSSPTNSGAEVSAGLEIRGTESALLLSRMSTTQRDALTAVDGMMIYNTTTNKFQGRANGVWVDLH